MSWIRRNYIFFHCKLIFFEIKTEIFPLYYWSEQSFSKRINSFVDRKRKIYPNTQQMSKVSGRWRWFYAQTTIYSILSENVSFSCFGLSCHAFILYFDQFDSPVLSSMWMCHSLLSSFGEMKLPIAASHRSFCCFDSFVSISNNFSSSFLIEKYP